MTGESESDEALLARAANVDGDGTAFGRLFRAHAGAVHSYCFHRLGSWGEAEDATSVVFLEAWRRRSDAVVVSGSLRSWLLGVATNVMRNQRRAARRYDAALYRLPPTRAEPDHADDVVSRLDDERRMRAVLAELAVLDRGMREAVVLVAMEGLTYAEAAVALGIPVGTVRSRLARARDRLKKVRTAADPWDLPAEVAGPAGELPARLPGRGRARDV
ncbi:RNA polymerase sigma factor [Frankia tisae]|uniref:RNA polymerase sigma factor n=1 Tax=Frankia tisae TaxID=2950104 RepID=UPI0021BE389B|nr:RNA polymerase sigma factor [Frankia tisae]